jgi:putative transposase
LSIVRQCELTSLARSTLYYEPVGDSAEDLKLMRWIDEQYTRTPFYGSRRMVVELKDQGWNVNRKRVQRLMQRMGLEAIYPKPRLSDPAPGHRIYPYLLRNVKIERPNQVWSTDITYVRLRGGFVYLVAILDWYSRYVLAWEVSTTLDTSFCLSALDWALRKGTPEIFNSDQGAQFTSADFTGRLKDEGIQISMDGRGRALDNVFVERLWRSVKWEEIYLKDYSGVPDAIDNLGVYFPFYNFDRPHQSLGNQTPAAVYFGIPKRTPQYQKMAMLQVSRVGDRRL